MQGVETTKIGRINAAAVYRDLLDNTQYGTALEQAKSFLIPLDDTRRPILRRPSSTAPSSSPNSRDLGAEAREVLVG
jgi:hypothetical protein